MDSTAGAFGAAKAGLAFDPVTFIKKPQVILRIVSLLFSIIVFGCTSTLTYEGICAYGGDANACSYGTGIGVIAFLGLIIFLVTDALFEKISSVQHRKYVVMADVGFSGFWTFLWFVGFCYLTNKWTTGREITKILEPNVNNAQAAIAFSFFSIISWVGITFFAVQRFRLGSQGAFQSSDQIESQVSGGGAQDGSYAPYSAPNDGGMGTGGDLSGGGYYQPPFSGGSGVNAQSQFQAPNY